MSSPKRFVFTCISMIIFFFMWIRVLQVLFKKKKAFYSKKEKPELLR